MNRWLLPVFLTAVVPVAPIASARTQDADVDRVSAIAELCREIVRNGDAGGISIVVTLGDNVLVSDGYGYVDAAGHEPARGESVCPSSGLFEQLVAASALKLAEAGALDLEADVTTILDGFDFGDQVVRVRHLLEHTSGLVSFSDFARVKDGVELEEVRAFLAESPLENEPGTCFAFRNANLLLAAEVVEKVAERPLRELVTDELLVPLGMEHTGWRDADGGEPFELEHVTAAWNVAEVALPAPYSSAALVTSAADLARWRAALAAGEVLDPDSTARMSAPARLEDGEWTSRGYGLVPSVTDDFESTFFGGACGETRSRVAWYEAASLCIALVATDMEAPLAELERSVARAVLGLPDPEVRDLPVSAEDRARYVGAYFVGCNRMSVDAKGERLVLSPVFGEPFALRFQGGDLFVSDDDPSVTVRFEVDENGEAIALVLVERGFELRAVRMG